MTIDMKKAMRAYSVQRSMMRFSYKSDDYFQISFEDWLHIWEESGKFNERGTKGNNYCMARPDITLPLSIYNAVIMTVGERCKLTHLGKPKSEHTKELMRQRKLGVPKSEQHKKNMSMASIAAHMRKGHKIRKTFPE